LLIKKIKDIKAARITELEKSAMITKPKIKIRFKIKLTPLPKAKKVRKRAIMREIIVRCKPETATK